MAVSRWTWVAGLALALAPAAGSAHEILHQVHRGRAVAVRVFEPGGDPIVGARAEVFSPSSPAAPAWTGSTDRHGWIAFVPDSPGRWRVRVVEAAGHGIDVGVDVTAAEGIAPSPPTWEDRLLRPLVAVAAIGIVFAWLLVRGRRRPA